MLKIFMKILALPVCLVLCLVSGLFELGLRLYSFVVGIIYLLLMVCLILVIVSGQWMNVGILTGITVGVILITALVGIAGAIIEVSKDRVKAFLIT